MKRQRSSQNPALDEYVREVVAQAPPLTPAQVGRLARALAPALRPPERRAA